MNYTEDPLKQTTSLIIKYNKEPVVDIANKMAHCESFKAGRPPKIISYISAMMVLWFL